MLVSLTKFHNEQATHEKNYLEDDLFSLYKRFQFNINQFLNVQESHKMLSKVEARALVYQNSFRVRY